MNDQLDENDAQDGNQQREAENGLNVINEIEENNEDFAEEVPVDENQEEIIERENLEIEANGEEILMEPVNVEQPDDNQNDLFNEVRK